MYKYIPTAGAVGVSIALRGMPPTLVVFFGGGFLQAEMVWLRHLRSCFKGLWSGFEDSGPGCEDLVLGYRFGSWGTRFWDWGTRFWG